jgi:hypothetical protein
MSIVDFDTRAAAETVAAPINDPDVEIGPGTVNGG